MCGVAGFLWMGRGTPTFSPAGRLKDMVTVLHHRGPDDEGIWWDGTCGLAHARLSIIDLSPAGHQPMSSADGSVWISFNGEIYNFQELRSELEAKGLTFRSRSDTEVIAEGYKVWGLDVFSRLRGMFALAIWDKASQRLVLARDRVGKKPLVYADLGHSLLFGSEIKSVLAWPGIDRSPDLAALDEYLSLQYVPAPRTAFKAIQKLPAAHYLIVEADGRGGWRRHEPVRYWRLPAPRQAAATASNRELEEQLVAQLEDAVRVRLVSDVPLGAFLSGGVDSSAVVAMMARVGSGRVKTFSIGFPNPDYDETRYARMVAERYDTDHEEMTVEPDAARVIPRLIWQYGEPFADPSMVPTYYVSEIARRKVTVALNGDGGDEAFMGYGRYGTCRTLAGLDRIPPIAGKAARVAFRCLPGGVKGGKWGQRLVALANQLAERERPKSQRYAFTITYFMDYMKREGYSAAMSEFLSRSALDKLEPYFDEAPSFVSGANWADIHTYLPDDLMVKVDIATMAHGLEARSPLLDHHLLEWAMGLPESVKTAGGELKAIFKRAMEPYLPHEVLYRPKMGFGCPIDHWLRGELKEMAYDTLLSESAVGRGIFERDYVRRLLDEHVDGTVPHHTRLWALLMMELWFRMWVDQPAEAALLRPAA